MILDCHDSADNGPADLGSVDCDDIGSAGPFLGAWQKSPTGGKGGSTWKCTPWEGGHHVIGVASWKGTIKANQVSTALVSSVDFLPTFAALAGVKLPADRAYDGIDISNVLLHGATEAHTTLFHPTGRGSPTHSVPAMRMGKQADSIVYLAPGNQSGSLRLDFCGGVCMWPCMWRCAGR